MSPSFQSSRVLLYTDNAITVKESDMSAITKDTVKVKEKFRVKVRRRPKVKAPRTMKLATKVVMAMNTRITISTVVVTEFILDFFSRLKKTDIEILITELECLKINSTSAFMLFELLRQKSVTLHFGFTAKQADTFPLCIRRD